MINGIDYSTERRFYAKILFSEGHPALGVVHYYRTDMTMAFFTRWKWYFEYRAALLRVKHPRAYIQLTTGNYPYALPQEIYRKKLRNELIAAKRELTINQRKLDYCRRNWNELFPIEDNPHWGKVQKKLKYYEDRVKALSEEYDNVFTLVE